MAQYKYLIEKIYANGGRKFLFLNVPPTSRSPLFLDQGTDVVNAHAAWVTAYNKGLQSMIKSFKSKHSGVSSFSSIGILYRTNQWQTTTVLYDTWSFMTKILDSPQEYGYPNATCINEDGVSCIWYNNYHPGQKYHQLQAADMKQHLKPLGAW
jgi:phospholipase/lecithinase/hemolysin